jgi:hypothetical protein
MRSSFGNMSAIHAVFKYPWPEPLRGAYQIQQNKVAFSVFLDPLTEHCEGSASNLSGSSGGTKLIVDNGGDDEVHV